MDQFLARASHAYAVDYFGVIIALSLLEWVMPRRDPGDALRQRWWANFSISVLDTVAIRYLFPLVGVAWAVYCFDHRWGLFNRIDAPNLVAFAVTLAALDLFAYAQHYVLHRVPMLWRLHRTHHSDHDFDFTTGVRFHPVESIYTTAGLIAVIFLLGAPPFAVLISQILLVAISFFEHANLRLPSSVDRLVRLFLVTPDMHRIHHSEIGVESRSNLGNVVPWWDRLFGTYLDQPSAGHEGIVFGVPEFRDRKHLTLRWMLAQPLLGPTESFSDGPEILIRGSSAQR
jgi:sterol desaturase/sphingolipid hydroxylase (fatty acid hydroxylase superfamily)